MQTGSPLPSASMHNVRRNGRFLEGNPETLTCVLPETFNNPLLKLGPLLFRDHFHSFFYCHCCAFLCAGIYLSRIVISMDGGWILAVSVFSLRSWFSVHSCTGDVAFFIYLLLEIIFLIRCSKTCIKLGQLEKLLSNSILSIKCSRSGVAVTLNQLIWYS